MLRIASPHSKIITPSLPKQTPKNPSTEKLINPYIPSHRKTSLVFPKVTIGRRLSK